MPGFKKVQSLQVKKNVQLASVLDREPTLAEQLTEANDAQTVPVLVLFCPFFCGKTHPSARNP